MLYIHSLKDLNPKSIEIESLPAFRLLKSSARIPIDEQKFKELFYPFFITQEEIAAIEPTVELISQAVSEIMKISQEKNPLYEAINLKRAMDMLNPLKEPVTNNLIYSQNMMNAKEELMSDFILIINNLHKLDSEQKAGCNLRLNQIFKTILRNDELFFNRESIVDDGEVEYASSAQESIRKGFMFHFTIDDELKKLDFNLIKTRIPPQELERVEKIAAMADEIKRGVHALYSSNMKMVEMIVQLYAYIRLSRGS